MDDSRRAGPLKGLKVIELAGIGPGPMAAMLLANMGATVLRVDRKQPSGLGVPRPQRFDLLLRGRRPVPLDLKQREAVAFVLDLVEGADILIEGFRLHEAQRSGRGQVVDAAMVDGVASLMTQAHGTYAAGMMRAERGTNITDSGAPFYDVYACADGRYIAIGSIEGRFYAEVLRVLGLPLPSMLSRQWERNDWPAAKALIAERVATRSAAAWLKAFAGTESCVGPVLNLDEATPQPHLAVRQTYVEIDGTMQPAPAPRFSRTPSAKPEAYGPWQRDQAFDILGPWLKGTAISQLVDSGLFD